MATTAKHPGQDTGPGPSDLTGQAGPTLRATRLAPPRLRQGTISRDRLTERLRAARPVLTLLVAPPGFGKTSLLADWAAVDERAFAWVAVDADDNDQATLWAYAGAALAAAGAEARGVAGPDLVALAGTPDPGAAIARALEGTRVETVLVLDDYFRIERPEVHRSVIRFAELAPPNVQVVISTRMDPPLPVARLRAAGDLVELRAGDLAFDEAETARFLAANLDRAPDAETIRILHERTEGWPAVLALAGLSLRGTSDCAAFLETFGASNRHVGDYLAEQVLAAADPATLAFMLDTAIVDHVCGALADAMTDGSGSDGRLARMEQTHGLVTPLDDRREWYRYHRLVGEWLRAELARRDPDRPPILHQRAAAWYAASGDPDRAVEHAIAGGDVDLAAAVIGASYMRQLELGRIQTLVGWLDGLGPNVIEADRRLGVVNAWTMHFLGRHDEGNAALAAAMRAPAVEPLPDGAGSIEATAALIGAAFPGNDAAEMLASARRAYELEADRGSPWQVTVRILLGFGLVRMGQFAEARDHVRIGAEMATAAELWMDALGAWVLSARIELETGDPEVAERLAREAIAMGAEHGLDQTPTYAFAQSVLGAILVRRGNPSAGAALLEAALPATRAIGEPLVLGELLVALGQARRMAGRTDEAEGILREADAIIGHSRHPGYLRTLRRALGPASVGRSADALSRREIEVLRALARGASKRQAAAELYVSFNTIHSQVRSIYRKLDVHSLPAAVTRARQRGLIE